MMTFRWILVVLVLPTYVFAHCQIPCGIYDDELRFKHLHEHIHTIEKSMISITGEVSDNQLTRWIINKEEHADAFSDILVSYFLTQRIKPLTDDSSNADEERYVEQLELIHTLLVLSMKAKQTTDLDIVRLLSDKLDLLETL